MMMEKYELPESLSRQLHAFERKLRVMETIVAVGGAGAGFVLSWVLVYASDRFWDTPGVVRLLLTVGGVFCGGFFGWYWLRHWIFRRRNIRELAKLIQKEYRQLGDRLQGIVELTENEQPEDISPALIHAAIRQVAKQTEHVDFKKAVKTDRSWGYGLVLACSVAVLMSLVFFNRAAAMNAFQRWLNPVGQVDRYTFVALDQLPDSMVVAHGEEFHLPVLIKEDSFKKPGRAELAIVGQQPIEAQVEGRRALFTIPGQTREAVMRIQVWDAVREIKVIPMHRPAIKKLEAFVTYPEYLEKSPVKQEVNGGHLTVLDGSTVQLRATLGRKMSSAEIVGEGVAKGSVKLTKEGFMTAGEKFDSPRKLTMSWIDTFKLKPKKPYSIQVHVESDRVPFVEFPKQSRYSALLVDEAKEIMIQAEDDHGLKHLGVEYYVTDPKDRRLTPMNYNLPITKGGPNASRLQGSFIFSPSLMKIPPQTIVVLAATTTDYYPDRGAVRSVLHKIYVLSRSEHAKEIKRRFEALQARLEDVARNEENIQDKTLELSKMDPKELKSDKTTEQIKQIERESEANRKALEQLTKEGMKLLEEAMRNKDFSEELLKEWAQMLQGMKSVSQQEMKKAVEALRKAKQNSNPKDRKEQLGKASKQQEEAIKKLQKLLKELNDALENMTARNFVNRLKHLATVEGTIKSKLQELLPKTVGSDRASLSRKLQRELERTEANSEDVERESEVIMDDLSNFFNRTRITKYDDVFKDMQKVSVLDKLQQQTKTIQDNRSISAMQQADYWASQFTKWANMLDSKKNSKSGQGKPGQGKQMTAEQIKLLLKLIRIVQEEENIRRRTRLLERRKEFDDGYGEKSVKEGDSQQKNLAQLREVIPKAPPKAQRNLKMAAKAMEDAERLLRLPQTDGETVAAETEVIERLTAGAQQSASSMGGAAGMSALMKMLMQQMGMGNGAGQAGGGSNAGGGVDPGDSGDGGKGSNDKRDDRAAEKLTGKSLENVPPEFRDALRSYFDEVEKLER